MFEVLRMASGLSTQLLTKRSYRSFHWFPNPDTVRMSRKTYQK
nr:MAG TPA: hypothetical protein [Caudoviricetes sp.]